MKFPYTMFTSQTSFKPLLLTGGGGGVNGSRVTVNGKEEISLVPTSENSTSVVASTVLVTEVLMCGVQFLFDLLHNEHIDDVFV